jgi:hypothetical protein
MVKYHQNKNQTNQTNEKVKKIQRKRLLFKRKKIFKIKKISNNNKFTINSKVEWNKYYDIDKKIFLEYGSSIFSDLNEVQQTYSLISAEKILRHNITPKNRYLLIRYTIELLKVLPNNENTFFQIIYLFDKFLEKTKKILDDNSSKIYFCVCFELAMKMESSVIFDLESNITSLFCIEPKQFENLLDIEIEILETIEFEINCPINLLDYYQISIYDFNLNIPKEFYWNKVNENLLYQINFSTVLISKFLTIEPLIFYNYKDNELNAATIIFASSMACTMVKNYDKNLINFFNCWMNNFIVNSKLDIKLVNKIYNLIYTFYDENIRKNNYKY